MKWRETRTEAIINNLKVFKVAERIIYDSKVINLILSILA